MMTIEQFDSLEVGDLIETSPVFKALSDEPLVLHVVLKEDDKAEFVVTYMGVTLGRWSCGKVNGELEWVTW